MNPYRQRTLFVGRTRELSELTEHVRSGTSTLVIGGRRAGKTRLVQELKDIGRRLVHVDAGLWELDNEAQAITQLGASLGVPCLSREELELAFRASVPLCLVIDEADRVLSSSWAGSFLAWLRAIDSSGPVGLGEQICFVLTGGPMLNGYRNPDDLGSPPLNTSARVFLEPLDTTARTTFAAPLAAQQLSHTALTRSAGGHPWLLESLLAELWSGVSLEEARDRVFEQCHHSFPVWKRQLGTDGLAFLQALRPKGIKRSSLTGRWRRHRIGALKARYLGLVLVEDDRVKPGPGLFRDWLDAEILEPKAPAWDLAISYAGPDTEIARAVKRELEKEFRVFFAPDESAYMWAEDLERVLPNIYGTDSRYVLVLSSRHYVKSHWALTEFRAVHQRAPRRLLVINCGGLPADMPPSVVYREATPERWIGLASDLKRRLAKDSEGR